MVGRRDVELRGQSIHLAPESAVYERIPFSPDTTLGSRHQRELLSARAFVLLVMCSAIAATIASGELVFSRWYIVSALMSAAAGALMARGSQLVATYRGQRMAS
jgi:hypothetical protein